MIAAEWIVVGAMYRRESGGGFVCGSNWLLRSQREWMMSDSSSFGVLLLSAVAARAALVFL